MAASSVPRHLIGLLISPSQTSRTALVSILGQDLPVEEVKILCQSSAAKVNGARVGSYSHALIASVADVTRRSAPCSCKPGETLKAAQGRYLRNSVRIRSGIFSDRRSVNSIARATSELLDVE